jgi:hypothetical protein
MTEKTYTHDDIRHSTDDFLTCERCGIDLMPGEPMTYFVGAKEGFHFYHEGACADAMRREVET